MSKKRIQKILSEYPKYCPKCKAYQKNVYTVCPECRIALIDAQKAHKIQRIRILIIRILFVSILIFATYGIQKGERPYYNQSIKLLVTGRFHDSRVEFWKAFSANPLCKFVNSGIEKIKYKITHRTVVFEIR